ncbi:GNAT family N-acetyltransferase [Herbiconiux ginsengi]|uniref:Protein N-acetyltransferase, RimJ/RimL family n=1 Tax=Herbiconiux ginsengi TaxID=381665 RepID=A0A1H3L4M7_9MICO|nr:GNAT family N-acetyltransferase [Herbiconiux ginsengi]SDY59373.1 Protein N-acetyltransferase, RimJ/RimL family [Herbiconiux ginsengi]
MTARLALRRCVEADYRAILDWIPDAAELYLFTGTRLTWPLTLQQLESLAATPRWTDWTMVEASAPLVPLGHVELAFVDGPDDPPTARISRVLVSPARRGRGLGGKLAALAVEKARELGAARVELAVIAGNAPAERIYAGLGFTPSSRPGKRPDVRELTLDLRATD